MNEVRLIDANALKERLKKLKAKADNKKYEQGLQDAIDCYFPQIIDDAPTVDVQSVKHGQWIIDYAEGTNIYHAHCSECGKEPTRNIGGDYYIDKLSDFCPNCGAMMGGDSNE